jgi:hypothetical protein
MQMIHHFTSDQKLIWFGLGEWVEEPDEVIFKHNGYTCRLIRLLKYETDGSAFGGCLCGYVKIPKDHPWHGKPMGQLDSDCHCGITFSGTGIFDESDDWYVGFDCGHYCDLMPSIPKSLKELYDIDASCRVRIDTRTKFPRMEGTYKNIKYVIEETKQLAMDVMEAANVQTSP